MYRCLAAETRRLSAGLQCISDQLQALADEKTSTSSPQKTSPLPPVAAATSSSAEHLSATVEAPSVRAERQQRTSAHELRRLRAWLQRTGLYAWLPLSAAPHQQQRHEPSQSLSHDGAPSSSAWLPFLWTPPTSTHTFHSLTYSVGASTALLSDAEKALTDTAAARLGLPRRFHWQTERGSGSTIGGTSVTASSKQKVSPIIPANTSMLWTAAMRTASGSVAPRPASATSAAAATAAGIVTLPTLPSVATAGEVFAALPTRFLSPASSSAPGPASLTSKQGQTSFPSRPSSAIKPVVNSTAAFSEAPQGGGILFSHTLEAYMVLLHSARTQALTRSAGAHNAFAGAETTAWQHGRLVLYASDQIDPLFTKAAQLIGVPHVRLLQTIAVDRELETAHTAPSDDDRDSNAKTTTAATSKVKYHTYTLDVSRLQAQMVEDVASGLYPMLVVGTFGSGLSGAVDPLAEMAAFSQRLGVWFHIDAQHGGHALLGNAKGEGGTALPPAVQQQMNALTQEFQRGARLADSISLPAGSSAIPYSIVPSSEPLGALPSHRTTGHGTMRTAGDAALLFVSHARKVAWSVQQLGQARQASMNQRMVPAVSDSDVLRVSSLGDVCGWLMAEAWNLSEAREAKSSTSFLERSATHSLPSAGLTSSEHVRRRWEHSTGSTAASKDVAHRLTRHQAFLYALLHAVRGDGRFDASLDGAAFGVVRLRWLMAADEATAALSHTWAGVIMKDVLAVVESEDTGSALTGMSLRALPPVQVYVGLVQLQRRLWTTVAVGVLPADAEEADGGADGVRRDCSTPSNAASLSFATTLAYVLRTLDTAAEAVKPDARV